MIRQIHSHANLFQKSSWSQVCSIPLWNLNILIVWFFLLLCSFLSVCYFLDRCLFLVFWVTISYTISPFPAEALKKEISEWIASKSIPKSTSWGQDCSSWNGSTFSAVLDSLPQVDTYRQNCTDEIIMCKHKYGNCQKEIW